MNAHPYAEIFPMLGEAELASLTEDVKANGLREPIVLFDGAILDGRNRQRACEMAGVEPRFETFEGTQEAALAYVLSRNVHRRHLSESQRAMSAGRLTRVPIGTPSWETAAKQLNVARRSVARALKVLTQGVPELAAAVDSDKIAVSDAEKLADEDPAKQRAVLERVFSGEAKTISQALTALKAQALVLATANAPPSGATIMTGDVRLVTLAPPGSIDCVVTDPPYGLENHHSTWGLRSKDYADGPDYALALLRDTCQRLVVACKPDAHLYFFSGYSLAWKFKEILEEFFWVQDCPLTWRKNRHAAVSDSQQFHNDYDFIWFCKMPEGHKRHLAKFATCSLTYDVDNNESGHSAQKPVDLLKFLIEQSTQPGEHVLDPFCGSGSTGVAALGLKRRFTGIELESKWADVAEARCRKVALDDEPERAA